MPKPRRRPADHEPPTVRTTLLIPEELWLRAKHRAAVERRALRDLLIEGLELRLAQTIATDTDRGKETQP